MGLETLAHGLRFALMAGSLSGVASSVATAQDTSTGREPSVPREASAFDEPPPASEGGVREGHQLFVAPADWIPQGYLRPEDPEEADPFRFTSGADLRRRAERYLGEIVATRAQPGAARFDALSEEDRRSLESLADARSGRHRWLPWPPGDRIEALALVMGVAFDGGAQARRSGEPEFYGRLLVVVEADPDTGYEVTEALAGELDRLSRPGGMIPSVEVVLLPASRLADLAHGVGIEAYASKYHLDFDREPVLAGYARWFDALVAERALEQALHDELYRAFLLDTSKRRPRRDRIGSIAFGDETRRYALRDHASGKELRPLPTDVLDLYRDRYPNLLGMRPLSPEGGATRHRMERAEGDAASRDYTIEATVGSDHPGGPFVFYVPEFLDQRSAIVRVEHRGPEDESFRRIEAFLAGPRLVPKGLGYRLDESRREPSVVVEPIVEGVHRFRVRVVGRRF